MSARRHSPPRSTPAAKVAVAGFAVAGALLLSFAFGWVRTVRVASINMMPTLALEDRVVVRGAANPESGDVVVYRSPFGDSLLVARIVAVAGQTVGLDETGLSVGGCPVAVPASRQPGTAASPAETCSIDASAERCDDAKHCPVPACDDSEAIRTCAETAAGLVVASEAVGRHCYCTRTAGALSSLLFESRAVPAGHVFVLNDNRVDERDSRIFGAIPLGAVVGVASFVYYASDESGIRWDRMTRRVS